MGARINERPVVVLAVNLDELAADAPERLRRDALVVDEGPAAAVGQLHAPQDEAAAGLDALRLRSGDRRVVRPKLERRADLAKLGAMAHEARLSLSSERQRKSVQQDGFAGARLAGQNGQPAVKLEVELVDQDNVADGEVYQHRSGAFAGPYPRRA